MTLLFVRIPLSSVRIDSLMYTSFWTVIVLYLPFFLRRFVCCYLFKFLPFFRNVKLYTYASLQCAYCCERIYFSYQDIYTQPNDNRECEGSVHEVLKRSIEERMYIIKFCWAIQRLVGRRGSGSVHLLNKWKELHSVVSEIFFILFLLFSIATASLFMQIQILSKATLFLIQDIFLNSRKNGDKNKRVHNLM